MRICHIITRLIVGGAQENTLLTCEGLHTRGHEVLLLAGPQRGPEGSLWERAQAGGYHVEPVPCLVREVSPVQDWRCQKQLRAHIASFRPDVVHTHSSKAGVLGRLAAKRADAKAIVHTIHGMSFNRTQTWPVRLAFRTVERIAGRWTDRIVSVADAMTQHAVEAGLAKRKKIVTVHSGIQVDRFDPARYPKSRLRDAWGFGPRTVVVGTIARLQANKGYEQLIRLMPDLLRRDADLRFVWVGAGPRRTYYKTLLTRAQLHNHVQLTGLVPPDDVPRLLAGMDILVHLSRWEGLPRAIVQASLMGVPVVGYDIDGTSEAVESGRTGFLAELDDTASVARYILELAQDPEKRRAYGQAGRQKCRTQFDHQIMVDRLEKLYQTLVG